MQFVEGKGKGKGKREVTRQCYVKNCGSGQSSRYVTSVFKIIAFAFGLVATVICMGSALLVVKIAPTRFRGKVAL